jgi:hypothetical protein
MVGSWMLGLNVEHTFDSAFCCSDMSVCQATAAKLGNTHVVPRVESTGTVANRDCNDYVAHAGAGLSPTEVPEVGKVCAMFGGGCNGVCGVENAALYERHEGCARIV